MKTIRFVRTGQAVSDFEVHNYVKDIINSDLDGSTWDVSNALILTAFRVKIKHEEINLLDYEFFVEDLDGEIHRFEVDQNGRARQWFDSQEIYTNLLTNLI
jgi:hypothetical protein